VWAKILTDDHADVKLYANPSTMPFDPYCLQIPLNEKNRNPHAYLAHLLSNG
jgi:hypothetical protein